MKTAAILLLSSQAHFLPETSLAPWDSLAQLSGFLLVLLSTALIIAGIERLRGR
jgi:hypothetical protein